MTRVAVTKATLRVPPTYFAVQHTERLAAEPSGQFVARTFAMALQVDDPIIRSSTLDLVEVSAVPRASFRTRERAIPFSIAKLARAIVAFEPDVIHQHFATWSGPAIRASDTSKAPLMVTLHGADVFAALRPVREMPLRGRPMLLWHKANVARAFRAARLLLPVSRFLADRAIDAGANPRSLEVHYQGVDTDFFCPGNTVLPDVPEVVFIGGFTRSKGPLDLLHASISAERHVAHRLVYIGAGPQRPSLDAARTANPHIEVAGQLTRDEIRERLRRASLLVLPTQVDSGRREAAGLVLLEAQACGVPVICYDSGGAPEMVDAGRTGLVVPEGDIGALTTAILEILRLGDLDRARMGAAAREWVVRERSLAVSVQRLREFYEHLG